jgi:hypothetical protein
MAAESLEDAAAEATGTPITHSGSSRGRGEPGATGLVTAFPGTRSRGESIWDCSGVVAGVDTFERGLRGSHELGKVPGELKPVADGADELRKTGERTSCR